MKITPILTAAAFLVAGTAFANAKTIAEIDTSDPDLKAYFNFDTNNQPTSGNISWNQDHLATWAEDGYGICGAGNTHPFTTNAGISASNGFTVSFDVNSITQNGALLSMTSGNMSQAWRSLSITYTDGTLSAQFLGNTSTAVTTTISSEVNTNNWTTVSLVGSIDVSNNNTLDLMLYVDGAHVGTSTTAGASNLASDTINNLQFGYYSGGNTNANMNIDNILIYSKALSADEVKTLTIPEPSAFGLLAGLGALALAGTRRRRKA